MKYSSPSHNIATLLTLTATTVVGMWTASGPARADSDDQEQINIRRGLQLAPVDLNLTQKNAALVGLGSYIANAQSGCIVMRRIQGCSMSPEEIHFWGSIRPSSTRLSTLAGRAASVPSCRDLRRSCRAI